MEEDAVSKKLCACLTGTVARKSADNFYNEFLLTNTHMCEYHFKELKEIYNFFQWMIGQKSCRQMIVETE